MTKRGTSGALSKAEAEFRETCRRNGWRFTRQRFAVYSFVRRNRTHPGVDDVLRGARSAAPRMTRESVFRILCDFADAGLVARLDHLPAARFDSCTVPHGHFVCSRCGALADFALPSDFEIPLPPGGAKAAFAEVRVSGLCARCARRLTGVTNKCYSH